LSEQRTPRRTGARASAARLAPGARRRIGLLLLALVAASATLAATRAGEGGARVGAATATGTVLGVTGNTARFKSQTGQTSVVDQIFLGWGQGSTFGSPFASLFPTLAPVPMLALGTKGKGGNEAITPGDIASGKGDDYLVALNQAIATWNNGIYVRPLAEMNNAANPWAGYSASGQPRDAAHSPATFKKAFARIYLILHGGSTSAVNSKLQQLGMPPVQGGDLFPNPFPRLRIVWSPLASDNPRVPGNAAAQYYPGGAYVDVEGGDIYDERLTDTAPWQGLESLYSASRSHGKPFAVPEWGLLQVDDPAFVQHMCTFLKTHAATEVAVFYESRPGSSFDLGSRPKSRAAYRQCITPRGAKPPGWASTPAPKVVGLRLTPNPASGPTPLPVQFSVVATLNVPVVHWTLAFGDGSQTEGNGSPPASVAHTYALDGAYQATLIVFASPPFTTANAHFLTSADVTVGSGTPTPVTFVGKPGAAPLSASFQTDLSLPSTPTRWLIAFGDGKTLGGSGAPPHFSGHTYATGGTYRVLLALSGPGSTAFLASTDVAVAGPPKGTAGGSPPTGTVLVNGKPFTGGSIPYGSKVDVSKGSVKLTTDTGTITVYGKGQPSTFVLRRGRDAGKPVVELRLVGGTPKVCSRKLSAVSATTPPKKKLPKKVIRQLWGNAKGHFRTRGHYASATIRGTIWLTADRCDGTLITVRRGIVRVYDFRKKKTILVRAGHSYLAKKP
jgi:PKD repeat protein